MPRMVRGEVRKVGRGKWEGRLVDVNDPGYVVDIPACPCKTQKDVVKEGNKILKKRKSYVLTEWEKI